MLSSSSMTKSRGGVGVLPLFLCALIAISARAATVDLSKDWSTGSLYNQNAAYCTLQANLCPSYTIGYVVAQNGVLVAEGYTNGNSATGRYAAFSATKSFATMVIGKLVNLGLVKTSDTLGDIFNTEADWAGVDQAAEKQTIPLSRLLTMTSGLVACGAGGTQNSLQETLNLNDYEAGQVGLFNYVGTNHILSHIIHRRAGQSPREFVVAQGLFSNLGIREDEYDWDVFGDVQGSGFGLQVNPRMLAKLAQLYLQNGKSDPAGNELIPSAWVSASEVDQLADGNLNSVGVLGLNGYGYQWHVVKGGGSGDLAGAAAALGADGQVAMYLPASNTTIAVMGRGCGGRQQSILLTQLILDNLSAFSQEQTCGAGVYSAWNFYRRNGFSLFTGSLKSKLLRGSQQLHV